VKTSSLIGHVVEVLEQVHQGRRPADAVVKQFLRARHYLGSSDRRYIADRTFAILRHHMLLNVYTAEALAALRVPAMSVPAMSVPAMPVPAMPVPAMPVPAMPAPYPPVMMAAAYEIRCAEHPGADPLAEFDPVWRPLLPDIECAAFLESVRTVQIPDDIVNDEERFLAVRTSLPQFVVREWRTRYGREGSRALCETMNAPAPICIRVNTLKCTVGQCREALAQEGITAQPTDLSPSGLVLAKRINAQGLLSFKQGWFEMQDEGSQLLSLLAEVGHDMTVIDACAGGGGKSLHLAALMQNRGRIIAVDVDRLKLNNVAERGARAGATIVAPLAASADAPPEELRDLRADVVLVDAPCSGTGTFRRSPWLKLNLTEEGVHALARTQRELLERYAGFVAPGGRLVYSTCTLLSEENQSVIESFLRDHPDFTPLPACAILARQGIRLEGQDPWLELLPSRTATDGFFGAVMVRSS